MEMMLGLAQCTQPEDGDVLAMARRFFEEASEKSVDLLVFPECLMADYDTKAQSFTKAPEPIDGPFATSMNALANEYDTWCIYTLNELPAQSEDADEAIPNSEQQKPYNTAVFTNNRGEILGTYRKVHLFKSDFTDEADRFKAGNEYFTPVQTPFGKVGMAICYDLRFPDQATAAAKEGCQIFVYPAAWFAGKMKEAQWRTLLSARAIENKMVVAGLSRADRQYIGQSCICGPSGEMLASAGPEACLLTCHIKLA